MIHAVGTRLNNFENQTTIKVNGSYTKILVNNTDKNGISKVQYRYRETGGEYSNWTDVSNYTENGEFTCDDIILALDNTKAFNFELKVIDKFQQETITRVNIDVGKPIFFISSNERKCYINNKEVLTAGRTLYYKYNTLSKTTGNISSGSWVSGCNTFISEELPIGTYIIKFNINLYATSTGFATIQAVLDNNTYAGTKQTVPFGSSQVTSIQVICYRKYTSKSTHKFSFEIMSNNTVQINSTPSVEIIQIAE